MKFQLSAIGFVLAALSVLAAPLANAQRPQSLGAYTDWQAFQAVEPNGQLVCFMASQPKNSEGNYTQRGSIWLLVSHRPGIETNVVSMEAGFTYKAGVNHLITIGNSRYGLFPQGETAWSFPEDDNKLIGDMKAGRNLVVDSESTRGTKIRDTFSLLGFTAAYNKISEACQVS